MRFRATITDVSTLTRIVQSMQKISTKCIIKFKTDNLEFICNADSQDAQIWTQLNVNDFFKDYRVESKYDNQISLEASLDTLLKALRSAQNALDVILKLSKRGSDPLLSFAIATVSATGARLEINHSVLIKILKPAEVNAIVEPMVPEVDISIHLPKLSKLKTVTDRMSNISESILISANHSGQLRLAIEKDEVKVDTTWKGLKHPPLNQDQENPKEPEEPETFSSVRLSLKSFSRFLSSYVVETATIMCLCSGQCVIFYVYIGDMSNYKGCMTFFIPGLLED